LPLPLRAFAAPRFRCHFERQITDAAFAFAAADTLLMIRFIRRVRHDAPLFFHAIGHYDIFCAVRQISSFYFR